MFIVKYLSFIVFLFVTSTSLSGQEKQCPCSNYCYNNTPSAGNNSVQDIQEISCLGGYQCYVAEVKCSYAFCPPKIICESACHNIKCPCNRTCELVRAENPPKSGKYVVVPTCHNPCNSKVDDFRCGPNYYCQLQLVQNSCMRKGEPCMVKPVCKNECCNKYRNVTCGNGAYGRCYDKSLSCPIGPCAHTYECRVPCATKKCPRHYACLEDHSYTCAPDTCCPPPGEVCIPILP